MQDYRFLLTSPQKMKSRSEKLSNTKTFEKSRDNTFEDLKNADADFKTSRKKQTNSLNKKAKNQTKC